MTTPGNPDYGPHRALNNDDPLERTHRVGRVVLVGDSATRRVRVLEGLTPAAELAWAHWAHRRRQRTWSA